MKSRLFYREKGHIRKRDVQPLSQSTRVSFEVPPGIERAEVFIAAQKQDKSAPALSACVGHADYSFDAPDAGRVFWLRAPMGNCASGEIEIPTQTGWSLAHDTGGAPVVRLRAWGESLSDEKVFPRYGDAGIESQRDEWLTLLPEDLQALDDRWEWCWRLAGWLSGAWPYANEFQATSYAPWDTRTILKWGQAGRDDNGEKPIVMCVHYAVCFIQFCLAMGVPARAVVLSPDLGSSNGHFVPEVWFDEFEGWAMVDPNLHLCYRDATTQRPLAVAELYARREELPGLAQCGAGFEAQTKALQNFAREHCFSGASYRLWGVWARHDWIASPQLAPPSHGAVLYAETDILWCGDDESNRNELAMFPHFLSAQELKRS